MTTETANYETIPTPCVIVDLPTAQRNIDKLAAYCKSHNLRLRPHTKTHKSVFMAKRQVQACPGGLTVAKIGEALTVGEASDDLMLAYPALDPARTAKVAELAKTKTIHVAVDSTIAADRLAEAARSAGSVIGILPDIDVGLHRTGVQTPEQLLAIAQHVARTKGLRLDGIFCYPGHVVLPAGEQNDVLAGVDAVLRACLDLYRKSGLEAKIVSGGSSPTAYQSHLVKSYTEIRPGTYIYNDMNMVAGNWVTQDDVAARVVCTVVSDAVPGKFVIDAGNKTLTSDRNFKSPDSAGFGRVVEYPGAKITRLTEEHGEVDVSNCDKRPKLGDRVNVIPNHICPCINLHDATWLREEAGSSKLRRLPTDARGKVF